MATIKGGKVTSIKRLKSDLKKGGGSQFLKRVPADDTLTVRFLTEPTEWVNFFEHYDPVRNFYPCSDDCPGCDEGDRPSQRYLANALDVEDTRVVPLVLPKTLAGSIIKKYEKYATLLDRDYELEREGTGFDTTYDVTPEAPAKMNVSRFDLLDLWAILEGQLEMADKADGDDDAEDDDIPAAKRGTPSRKPVKAKAPVDDDDDDDDEDEDDDEPVKPTAKSRTRKAPVAVEDDDDDDEDEDADESEEDADEESDNYTRSELIGMSLIELKGIAKEVGFTTAELRGMDKDAIADAIMALYSDADADDDDDDADADDADDDDAITEDQLRDMSLAELKTLAKELGVRVKAGTPKDDIIELVLDAAGEDDDEAEVPF